MKKLALVLAILMAVLPLASCGDNVTAYEAYVKMSDAMGAVSSMEGTIDATVSMTSAGVSYEIGVSGTTKEVIRSDTDMDMEMTMDMTMLGETFSVATYYKEGYMYQDLSGMKYKLHMDIEDAVNQMGVTDLEFTEDIVKESSVTDVDGGKELSFTLDGTAMTDILSEIVASLTGALGADGTMTFGDVTYNIVVDKDYIERSCEIIFSISMEIDGETVDMSYDMRMDISSVNNTTITFPDDLDSYTEITADQLG